MDEKLEMEVINNLLFSDEAAEYLGITMQRLNQLVHDKKIIPVKKSKASMLFRKSDLEVRTVANYSNQKEKSDKLGKFKIDDQFVRNAIFYYTVQQYFNNNDKKTSEFLDQIKRTHSFRYDSKLENNIPLLSSLLKVSKNEFYSMYTEYYIATKP